MSSPENDCIDTLCSGCVGTFCTNYTEACTASIEENCQESCDQACTDACNQACSNACSQACSNVCANASCSCGTPSIHVFSTLMITIGLPLLSFLILGIIQAFDPRGPLFMTLIGSGVLVFSLSGVRINNHRFNSGCKAKIPEYTSRLGFLSINHSHHSKVLIDKGHEFKLRGKYFCAGCYGLLIGTILALFFAGFYILFEFTKISLLVIGIFTPFCFIPIIFRYTVIRNPSIKIRIMSNSLLPIGCCFLIILMDSIYHLWIVNVITVLFILLAAYIRSIIAFKENNKIN